MNHGYLQEKKTRFVKGSENLGFLWHKTRNSEDSDLTQLYEEGGGGAAIAGYSLYRVAQNHGKQVLRISPIKFLFHILQFVVIPHGQRDLSSLPWTGEAAVQIS